jgi:hypothetical protein
LVGSLPIFLIAYASFAVPFAAIASWVLQNACQYLLSGASVGVVADLLVSSRRTERETR